MISSHPASGARSARPGPSRVLLPLLAAALMTALSTTATAFVGKWHSFTDMNRVTSLAAHGGFVYAGTLGGVRRVDPANPTGSAQRDFNNLDGLIDPWITGLVADQTGTLWAVARSGYVYELNRGGERWSVHGGSYAAQEWRMNERAVLSAGNTLFLGSQKGLALFDTRILASQLALTRFGDELDVPVLSLLRRSDTLFVGTTAGVYKARLHFPDPLNPPDTTYDNPADPNQWTKVEFPEDPARRYDHLAIVADTLATFGPGTLLQGSPTVRAFAGDALEIGSQVYPSWTNFVAALATDDKVFVGGDSGLAVSANPTGSVADAVLIPPLRAYPRDTIANIGAYGDIVWGHSQSGIKYLDIKSKQVTPLYSPVTVNGPGTQEELYYRFLRNVVVTPLGDVYIGSWGGGLVRRRANGANSAWRNTAAGTGTCLTAAEPGNPFTVIPALSRPRPGSTFPGLFFTVRLDEQTFQMAYFDTTASIALCPPSGLSITAGIPHAVHLFSDTLLGVASEQGVTLMRVREESTGPRFENIQLWTLPGAATATAWDLATDGWDRPWAIIGDQLAFLDSLDGSTTRKLTPIDNFIGVDCKSLESDPAGKLWVGCSNGLFHVATDPSGQLASVLRYGLHDGLPSLFIYDVTVDQANGKVWIATDRGVAMLESASQPALKSGDLAPVTPYPNPFRPHHSHVIFGELPPNSTLRIHAPGGQVIRIFHPRDLKGNEAQWDGRNENGRPVLPGVYLFSVVSGGTVQRGKVIVAR